MLARSGLSGLGSRTLRDALEKCLRSGVLRLSRLPKCSRDDDTEKRAPEGTRQSGQGAEWGGGNFREGGI